MVASRTQLKPPFVPRSCEKIMSPDRTRKISPDPSFPKEGNSQPKETDSQILSQKIVLSVFDHSPFEKGGQQGDFDLFTASLFQRGNFFPKIQGEISDGMARKSSGKLLGLDKGSNCCGS